MKCSWSKIESAQRSMPWLLQGYQSWKSLIPFDIWIKLVYFTSPHKWRISSKTLTSHVLLKRPPLIKPQLQMESKIHDSVLWHRKSSLSHIRLNVLWQCISQPRMLRQVRMEEQFDTHTHKVKNHHLSFFLQFNTYSIIMLSPLCFCKSGSYKWSKIKCTKFILWIKIEKSNKEKMIHAVERCIFLFYLCSQIKTIHQH